VKPGGQLDCDIGHRPLVNKEYNRFIIATATTIDHECNGARYFVVSKFEYNKTRLTTVIVHQGGRGVENGTG
jgi:hypothetical protein